MRLNKGHKSSILTRIKNQTKPPFKTKADELKKRFQEWVYTKADPCFKQYQELYKGSIHTMYISEKGLYCSGVTRLEVRVPVGSWVKDQIGTYGISLSEWKPTNDSVLNAIVDDFAKACKEQKQYENDIENLKTIINNCSTDTQLLEMFPEFKNIIDEVCVRQEAVKQLPATMGLPQSLERWGVRLNEENTGSSNSINDTES
ncbi:Nmad5 family putative nucleotide modification protein [Pasteurella multocida]